MPNPSKPFGLLGQFQCGNKRCENQEGLKSWEVNFAYVEQGEKRNALVKLSKCSVFLIDVLMCGDMSGYTVVRMRKIRNFSGVMFPVSNCKNIYSDEPGVPQGFVLGTDHWYI